MPTYRPVIIPEIHSEITRRDAYGNEEIQREIIGEFKASIRPIGLIRRCLTKFNHEISPYWRGSLSKFRLTIERKGSNKPFNFRLQQIVPNSQIICLESNITADKYEKEFEISFSNSGQYSFFVGIYSQIEWEESKKEIVFLRVFDWDSMIVSLAVAIFSAGIGYLIGRFG